MQATTKPSAKIIQEIGSRLFERLDYMKFSPQVILNITNEEDAFSQCLLQRYPTATVLNLDVLEWVATQGASIKTRVDLVFANLVLHQSIPFAEEIAAIKRVMNPEGCFLFSLLGLDTYSELTPFFAANPPVKTPVFMDMHPVGDALLANHFIDPVVDMQRIVALYPNWHALKAGLHGFEWEQEQDTAHSHPHDETGRFPLTYEVIFGQAWTGDTLSTQHGNDVFIPVDSLRRR